MATFSVIVNPSLIHNTCYEVMQTATFRTKTYLNNLYYLKLTRLLTLSYVFLFGGKSATLHCHFFQLGSNEYWCLLPLQLPVYHLSEEGQNMGTRWKDCGSCTKYWWTGPSVSRIRVKTVGREKGNKKSGWEIKKLQQNVNPRSSSRKRCCWSCCLHSHLIATCLDFSF